MGLTEKSHSWILGVIEEYVDDDRNYAIALDGDWGSGKTRFIENVLKPYLNERKEKSVIRVSLFGLSDSEELRERIAYSLMGLEDAGSDKRRMVIGGVFATVRVGLKKVASILDLPLDLSIRPGSIVNLLLDKQYVLVFDDAERRGTVGNEADESALFGAINDLVEGKGIKAIFVTNSASCRDEERPLEGNIREKMIWRTLRFEPDPDELVRSVYSDFAGRILGRDILGIISKAASRAQCRNARAMIKAARFVRELCNVPVLDDGSFAEECRISALEDGLHFGFLCCMGREPSPPGEYKSNGRITPELLQHNAQEELYRRYSAFPCIARYFDPQSDSQSASLEDGMRQYLETYYSDSEDTLNLKKIEKRFNNVADMEDEEANSLFKLYCDTIERASFSVGAIRSTLVIRYYLSRLGYLFPFGDDAFMQSCEKVISRNPSQAVRLFSFPDFFFGTGVDAGGEDRHLVDRLRRCAEGSYADNIARICENDDALLSDSISNICEHKVSYISRISPETVARRFFKAPPAEQNEIRRCFIHLSNLLAPGGEDAALLEDWIRGLRSRIEEETICSKTDGLRRDWFIQNLDDVIGSLYPESGEKK